MAHFAEAGAVPHYVVTLLPAGFMMTICSTWNISRFLPISCQNRSPLFAFYLAATAEG